MRTLLLTLFLAFTSFAQATWYESAGRATLLDNEESIARNLAIQDALRQAMLYAGADVSSIQQLKQGLLQQDQLRIRSHGSVRDIQLIEEHQEDDYLYVTIRVDIVKEMAQCQGGETSKSIAITHFPLRQQQHATTGAIYKLTEQAPARLLERIQRRPGKLIASQLLHNNGEWAAYGQPRPGQLSNGAEQWLNRQTDAQYILIGEIRDLSLDKFDTSWFGIVDKTPQRNFSLNLQLIQRYNGQQVWQQQYHVKAPWEFPIRQHVDVSSHEFWQSAFGQAIDRQLTKAFKDINAKLACEQSTGEIISVSSDRVTVNLGTGNGLQAGDVLKVLHQSSFTDPQGRIRQQIKISDGQLVVDKVHGNYLIAKPMGEVLDGGIQIRDLVVKE